MKNPLFIACTCLLLFASGGCSRAPQGLFTAEVSGADFLGQFEPRNLNTMLGPPSDRVSFQLLPTDRVIVQFDFDARPNGLVRYRSQIDQFRDTFTVSEVSADSFTVTVPRFTRPVVAKRHSDGTFSIGPARFTASARDKQFAD